MTVRAGLVATLLLLYSEVSLGVDISDPKQFMFAGDRRENVIDVIALSDNAVVHRIATSIHPDHIVATPFAPIIMYADIEKRQAVFYDLRDHVESEPIDLAVTPRHVVLDTTGAKIAITDDVDGGFVLLHAYKKSIEFVLEDFPPTGDVLFDPNDVDVYFSDQAAGALGMLDINTQRVFSMPLTDDASEVLSAPSRSLDARYIYVSNVTSGEVYSLNAYSRIIFNTFTIGGKAGRPYTTPQGAFLYMLDETSGRFVSMEQRGFTKFTEVSFGHRVNLVVVGRFDRMNLFTSTLEKRWSIFDNVTQKIVASGAFTGRPIEALGSADGKYAYVALADTAEIAVVNLETQSIDYVPATSAGSGSFTVGLSNNVCH